MRSDLVLSGYTSNPMLLVLTLKVETNAVIFLYGVYVEMTHKKNCYRKQGTEKTKLTSVPAAPQDP